jgi:hypothetical protein
VIILSISDFEKAQISFLVDGKPKADSSGKAGIYFTILEYLVFQRLIMSSLVLVNKILRHKILTVLSMF